MRGRCEARRVLLSRLRVSDTRHILPRSDCKDFVVSVITGPGDCMYASFQFSSVDTDAPSVGANEPTFNYSSDVAS